MHLYSSTVCMFVYFKRGLCAHGHAIMLFGLCKGKPIDNYRHTRVLYSDVINTGGVQILTL